MLGLRLAVWIVVDVDVRKHDTCDVFHRELWGVSIEFALHAEVMVVFVELAGITDLPHVVKLLERHLGVAPIHSVSEIVAISPADFSTDTFHLFLPVWSILGVDVEIVVNLLDPALVGDDVGGAPPRESFAELIIAVRVPLAEVLAVVWVSSTVAFCAVPELLVVVRIMVAQAATLRRLVFLLALGFLRLFGALGFLRMFGGLGFLEQAASLLFDEIGGFIA